MVIYKCPPKDPATVTEDPQLALLPAKASPVVGILTLLALGMATDGVAGQSLQDISVPDGQAFLIGVTIDSTTGVPLAGAAIYVVESDASAVSDSLGRFALGPLPIGLYRVSFFHERLKVLGISVAPLFLVNLTASAIVRADLYVPRGEELARLRRTDLPDVEPIMLEAIEVVADRGRELRDERTRSGGNVFTLEREQIDARVTEARHVGDLLSGFTSLRITSPGGGVLCIESRRAAVRSSSRGRCVSQVAVYLDGVPLADPEFSLLQLRPTDLERVEFLNGVIAGARYGRDAGNGVLLLETRRPR